MDKKTCETFLKVDILFDDGKLNLAKINKQFGKSMRDCPYDNASGRYKCKTDLEGIKGLCSHLFTELFKRSKGAQKRESNDTQYVEYVMMWLGYRLFQTESYSSPTLSDFYNSYLMKSDALNNYDSLIMKKKDLKDANIYYMGLFYQLVQQICYITVTYSKNNFNVQGIKKDSTEFYNKYTRLYADINECDSYLNLLNNLKTQYENLKKSLINNNSRSRLRYLNGALIANFKDLPAIKQKKKTTTVGFNCEKCKKVNSNAKKKTPKPTPKPREPVNTKPVTSPSPKPVSPGAAPTTSDPQPQKSEIPPAKPTSATSLKESPPPSAASSTPAEQQSLSSESPPTTQQTAHKSPSTPTLMIQKGSPDSQGSPNAAVSQSSNQKDTSKDSGSGQHNASSDIGKQGGDILDKQEQSQDGKQQISDPKQGISDGSENSDPKHPTNKLEKQLSQSDSAQHTSETKESSPSKPKDIPESKKPQKEGSSHPNGQDASKINPKVSGSENGNPNGESNEPGAPSGGSGDPPSRPNAPSQDGKSDITNPPDQAGTSNTSGGSIDLWSPFFKLLLNGKEYFNKASDFVEKNRQRFNDAKDKISNVYNDTVDNLKRVYNASSIYFSVMINSITNQLYQADAPKLGSSEDNLPQSSDQSKKIGDPLPPQPSNPTPDSTPDPASNPSLPPPDSPEQNQSSPQLQSTTLQTPQVSQPTQKTIDQLVKSPSSGSILRNPWNIIPTTWNGSGDCKPKINLMSATLLCCTSEQCSLTGISVIFILIPIISLIVYKYLSFGSSKKSEKKNMKRVINFHDGKSKTKIIISSNNRNKDLKPVINSVDRKKDPLLNIYKLMQADPIPFINLFFLLIFFVYKRKSDFLEL
ncbi:PIR protein CIR protein [Plasmodium vinckei lentum]|uniref:PIR protein CIR protein n=1 Tax=Plasmodium vinckei lentum TaxID=138297 RepID=A0A6V7RXR5_PLAVN|nr:PIR protein CIR protein [Plasmodium vinckei lentum]